MFGKLVDDFLKKRNKVTEEERDHDLWFSANCPKCQEISCDDDCENSSLRFNNSLKVLFMKKNSSGTYELCEEDFKDLEEWNKYQAGKNTKGAKFILKDGTILTVKGL